jgi:hypothetical protein
MQTIPGLGLHARTAPRQFDQLPTTNPGLIGAVSASRSIGQEVADHCIDAGVLPGGVPADGFQDIIIGTCRDVPHGRGARATVRMMPE